MLTIWQTGAQRVDTTMEAQGRPILIIDDDRRTRDVIAHLVRLWGRHALEASSIAAGLALLDADPHCIILDLGLPDGSGEAVLREVRARGLPCRVIVCSGEADPNLPERLKTLGADFVLTKPVAADDLENACLGAARPTDDVVTQDTAGLPPCHS